VIAQEPSDTINQSIKSSIKNAQTGDQSNQEQLELQLASNKNKKGWILDLIDC